MKRNILTLCLCAFVLVSLAQQKPHYTQYILNNYILNPALTGIENYTDVKMSARDQWIGLKGAPQTFYLSLHGPLGKKDYKSTVTSFDMPGENPRGSSYWDNYTASEPHHGIGFFMIGDKTGLYNRFTADVSYAYHLGLSPKTNIAAGFSGGISKLSYDRTKATPVDPNDPAIGGSALDIYKFVPDLNAGIWIYSANYFVGVAAQQIASPKVSFNGATDGFKLLPHIFATTGYRFLLNEDINAIPSIMIKYVAGSPVSPQFDLNVKLQYQDKMWVGASYRIEDGYAAMVGLNVASKFNVGYSYDLTTTKLNTVSRGTHEIVLGFLLGNHYGDTCPRNVW
jgi:type IX secretion system PorP/SprF family membrane protein